MGCSFNEKLFRVLFLTLFSYLQRHIYLDPKRQCSKRHDNIPLQAGRYYLHSIEYTAPLFSTHKCMIMHTQGLDNCHKRPILPRVSPDPVIGGEITERTEKRRRRSQNHGARSSKHGGSWGAVSELWSAAQSKSTEYNWARRWCC